MSWLLKGFLYLKTITTTKTFNAGMHNKLLLPAPYPVFFLKNEWESERLQAFSLSFSSKRLFLKTLNIESPYLSF